MKKSDYKSVKIDDKIIIVERQAGYKINDDWRKNDRGLGYHQGIVVDISSKQMLDTAMIWAGSKGIIHKYDNGNFELTICDCAEDAPYQGGKLSFWNCIITCPDGKEFLVGINSDILLELIISNDFINGKCQRKIWLGRISGKLTGAFTENMDLFAQAKKDESKRKALSKSGNNYVPGDVVKTLTETQVYLGEVYCLAEEEEYHWDATLNLYKKPQKRYVFIKYEYFINNSDCFFLEIKKTKPKRIIESHIELNGKTPYNMIKECYDEYEKLYKGRNSKILEFERIKLMYSESEDIKNQQAELIDAFTKEHECSQVKINFID